MNSGKKTVTFTKKKNYCLYKHDIQLIKHNNKNRDHKADDADQSYLCVPKTTYISMYYIVYIIIHIIYY